MNSDILLLYLFLLTAFVFPVFSLPKEWDAFYKKNTNNKEDSEHAKRFKETQGLSDEKVWNYLYKCVDLDFLHYDFLDFCIKISLIVIDRKNCHSTTEMQCKLATYYMGRHFKEYSEKEDKYANIEAERKNNERVNTILGQKERVEKFLGRRLEL